MPSRAHEDPRVTVPGGNVAGTPAGLAEARHEPQAMTWTFVVETMGLEPTTPCLQSRCSSQLSYVPGPAPAGLGTTSVPSRRHRPKLAARL